MNDRIYRSQGAHLTNDESGCSGVRFGVWAPNATRISVVGDFNEWNDAAHTMTLQNDSGLWSCFVNGAKKGQPYRYRVFSSDGFSHVDKSDPVGFYFEKSPQTASIIWDLNFRWTDDQFVDSRPQVQSNEQAISIYEMHVGSWRKGFSYRDL